MASKLPPGIYESLVTLGLRDQIDAALGEGWWSDVGPIDERLVADVLGRHLHDVSRRSIASIRGEGESRLAAQVDLVNRVLAVLREGAEENVVIATDSVAYRAEILRELQPPRQLPVNRLATPRPHISLRESGLLVNGHRDYQIGAEVARELASADRVDLLCAFVRFAGLRLIRRELEAFRLRGGVIRVIASVYTGSTEKRALDELVQLGGRVKVSYETSQTRLHAKAWLFHRDSGFSTAYIGSSNLTRTALVEGLEWNVRASQVDNPAIVERVAATFDQYWNEPAFIAYDPELDGERLAHALNQQRLGSTLQSDPLFALNLDFAPQPHQDQMLEALDAERQRGHHRNLVVSATGTGKTWVSAFDYRRLRKQGHERLLFVAHRDEILHQSQTVFRLVLKDASFGERWIGSERPELGNHVFASIQSLHRHVDDIDPGAWDVVIVDEFHHAEAPTYRRLLERLKPRVLIGLTATPERADGKSVLEWFDGRIAVEVRLWQALEQALLCPFHYFGVHDDTDLSQITFTRGRYSVAELEALYTSDHARGSRILAAVEREVLDPSAMRALGFCVGVANAELMARVFTQAGLPSVALHSGSDDLTRKAAVGQLRRGELRAIFTVDLFNEGIDIPEVDTILLLRPTESATVFLQQLGRGLRHAEGKSVLTVLDFVGAARREYRFETRYQALIGGTRKQVASAVEQSFPLVPPGCAITLDRITQALVLANIRAGIRAGRGMLVDDLRALPSDTDLAQFLRETGHGLEEVYARPSAGHTFTRLRRDAGYEPREPTRTELELSRSLGRMLHINDQERVGSWLGWLADDEPPSDRTMATRAGRLQWMFYAALGQRSRAMRQVIDELWQAIPLRQELVQLLATLDDEARAHTLPIDPNGVVPLHSHADYTLYEIIAAYGLVTGGGTLRETREGVLWAATENADLLFVTLQKGDSDYSPSTRYEDYPISPTLFHWESQNSTRAASPTGRRYIEHAASGSKVILFVREQRKDDRGETVPYTCLGPVQYVSHESERPMRIVWQLERPMPAGLFQLAKVAAG